MLARLAAVLAITACGNERSAPKGEPAAGSGAAAGSVVSPYERDEPKRVAARRELFGTAPAGLNGRLATVAFGAPPPADIADTFQTVRDATGLRVEGDGAGRLETLTFKPDLIGPDGEKFCERFERELAALWGAPTDGVWVDVAASRRAYIQRVYPCELVFESFAAPAAWISKAAGSVVPMSDVGKPADAFGTKLHDRIETGGTPLHTEWKWLDKGLAGGQGQTDLVAHVIKGKLAWVEATVLVEPAGLSALKAHLTKAFGEPSEEGQWASKPPITLETGRGSDGNVTTVTVGEVQDE